MTPQEIFNKVRQDLGEQVAFNFHDSSGGDKDPWFQVEPYSIEKVCKLLKTDRELHFDYLECLTGIDFPDDKQIQVVYHLSSYKKNHRIVLKCMLDRDEPAMPSVCDVWRAANWQERECYDLLGVLFDGHPDLRRLLLPDDWLGHPLRKDYQQPAEYHGIPTTRPNILDILGAEHAGEGEAGD